MSEATIPIKELMEKTEQWLLGQGYKKSTLGFYRATWNRFLSYSASPAYSRETAEQFLLQYFGVDVHAIDQTLDGRMRHARRHMNALDEIFRTGTVCRRKVYGVASIDDDCFDKFFSDYLSYCKMQNFSRSWMDNTIAALRLFLLAVHSSNTQNIKSINAGCGLFQTGCYPYRWRKYARRGSKIQISQAERRTYPVCSGLPQGQPALHPKHQAILTGGALQRAADDRKLLCRADRPRPVRRKEVT